MNGKLYIKRLLQGLLILAWGILYWNLQSLSKALASVLSSVVPSLLYNTRLYDSLVFFLYDTPKVFMLLVTVVFVVGIIRTFFAPDFVRKRGVHRKCSRGNAWNCDSVLLLFRCSFVHRFLIRRRTSRRHIFLPGQRPHGE